MCGYCTEIIPIRIAMEQAQGLLWDFQSEEQRGGFTYYLEECHDLNLALASNPKNVKTLAHIANRFKDDELIYIAPLEVIFCRVIEVLVKHGSDSQEYQALITNESILSIIEYEARRPRLPGEDQVLPKTPLDDLINGDVFTTRGRWEEISSDASFMEACEALLSAYIGWWHGRPSRAFPPSQETDKPEELDVFRRIYPLVFLSLIVIARDDPGHESIQRLIETNPDTPFFEALELWLQRKASLILYDHMGLDAFLPYNQTVRPVLIYYLAAINKLNETEKGLLREAIIASGRYDENQTESGSPFCMHVEPLIMEQLRA